MTQNIQADYQRSGLNLAEIVDHCGVSKTTASQIVKGKYGGSAETVGRVHEFIRASLPAAPSADAFRPTPGQRRAMALLDLLRKKRKFGLVVGASGIGKTRMLTEYQRKWPEVEVYRVRQGQSMGGLLGGLCRLWGLPHTGSNDTKLDRLIEAAPGRFLAVDEADNISRARHGHQVLRMIEVFRYLYDAGAGVVLVGLPSIYTDICQAGETYVFSRIRYLNTLTPPDRALLTAYWQSVFGDANGATEGIIGNAVRAGYFRYLNELADAAREFGDLEAAQAMAFNPNLKVA
jgi:DNA transposition AAA+ family ATPase